jgi:hypothetical protein
VFYEFDWVDVDDAQARGITGEDSLLWIATVQSTGSAQARRNLAGGRDVRDHLLPGPGRIMVGGGGG